MATRDDRTTGAHMKLVRECVDEILEGKMTRGGAFALLDNAGMPLSYEAIDEADAYRASLVTPPGTTTSTGAADEEPPF